MDDPNSVQALKSAGARLRRRKSGTVHTVDLSGVDGELGDEVFGWLSGLSRLAELNLAGTQITDAGLVELGQPVSLEHLDLQRTAIGDAVVPYLRTLKGLRVLVLTGTHVTRAAVDQLRPEMVDTRIILL